MGKGLHFQNIQRKKIRKNNVESSIEPPTAESYFSASSRVFHSRSHIVVSEDVGTTIGSEITLGIECTPNSAEDLVHTLTLRKHCRSTTFSNSIADGPLTIIRPW